MGEEREEGEYENLERAGQHRDSLENTKIQVVPLGAVVTGGNVSHSEGRDMTKPADAYTQQNRSPHVSILHSSFKGGKNLLRTPEVHVQACTKPSLEHLRSECHLQRQFPRR